MTSSVQEKAKTGVDQKQELKTEEGESSDQESEVVENPEPGSNKK